MCSADEAVAGGAAAVLGGAFKRQSSAARSAACGGEGDAVHSDTGQRCGAGWRIHEPAACWRASWHGCSAQAATNSAHHCIRRRNVGSALLQIYKIMLARSRDAQICGVTAQVAQGRNGLPARARCGVLRCWQRGKRVHATRRRRWVCNLGAARARCARAAPTGQQREVVRRAAAAGGVLRCWQACARDVASGGAPVSAARR